MTKKPPISYPAVYIHFVACYIPNRICSLQFTVSNDSLISSGPRVRRRRFAYCNVLPEEWSVECLCSCSRLCLRSIPERLQRVFEFNESDFTDRRNDIATHDQLTGWNRHADVHHDAAKRFPRQRSDLVALRFGLLGKRVRDSIERVKQLSDLYCAQGYTFLQRL